MSVAERRELVKIPDLLNSITQVFQRSPFSFFTEHDIHSELHHTTYKLLEKVGLTSATTTDGIEVKLVHHEYPTPFRCDMRWGRFQVKEEHERTERGGKFRRGHIDLIILNPRFVSQNCLDVVTGKNYQTLLEAFRHRQPSPLSLAVEVAYFPSIRRIPERAPKTVKQDYDKLVALQNYKILGITPFCKKAVMTVFTSHGKEELMRLESDLRRFILSPEVPMYLISPERKMMI